LPTSFITVGTGRPSRERTIASSFVTAKARCPAQVHLHFHDLRGTAATRFYVAGLSERIIGEIMGWTEENVTKIIRKYVDRAAATKAIIRQLNENRTG
jgi:integrase